MDHNTPERRQEMGDNIISLKGMYKDYFLDYASYVILERAVPSIGDGLKPVQRRILHAMREMHDGRYHKVANIIGQTMQYHPHGDAAINDALVNLGQKDLLIDCQGNWGDPRTGDSAAAARYIEARLTKFALDVLFNPQTTQWQLSYDGRKREPVDLPAKFPLLLAQGVEGIAVGLSTKILPHNFVELIEASIRVLQGKPTTLLPDFDTGGYVDVMQYNGGARGGRVRVRAKIKQLDKSTLCVHELPFGVTTSALIDSIVKAAEKGKIKIKNVVDNTAEHVEVLISLPPGISPDVTTDALYAFTSCEVSISPNACIIVDDKPMFTSVDEILRMSTEQTKALLKTELEILLAELREKWHFASLEKIFIEKRIYRDIEECENWEEVLLAIDQGLRRYVRVPGEAAQPKDRRLLLWRDISDEDIQRLTDIKIRRISKYNVFEAEEHITDIEMDIERTVENLDNLTDYAIAFFEELLKKYGKGKGRRTEIREFDSIQATVVAANNAKLYVNRQEGFIGLGMKKDEFVCDCSDIDDIIVFRRDGKFVVTRIQDKVFVGKDILHVGVWRKGDERTTYNMIYLDGSTGTAYAKRFNVAAITRDREYELTTGEARSKVLYFTANPNGESEVVSVHLSPTSRAKIKTFDFDFAELDIKNRSAKGNILTKYPVRRIAQREVGKSTLGAQEIWMDEVSGKLNTDGRGIKLGAFDTGDSILALYKDGSYEQTDFELSNRYEVGELLQIVKSDPALVLSCVYFDGHKQWTMVKRFHIETSKLGERFSFISDHKQSKLLYATLDPAPRVRYDVKVGSKKMEGEVDLAEFIDVKGWRAQGNKLSDQRLSSVQAISDSPLQQKLKAAEDPGPDADLKQGSLF